MNSVKRVLVLIAFGISSFSVSAGDVYIDVNGGDVPGLRNAFTMGNMASEGTETYIRVHYTGLDFVFDEPVEGTDSAVPKITANIAMGAVNLPEGEEITFRPSFPLNAGLRYANIGSNGSFKLNAGFHYTGFKTLTDGGVFNVEPGGTLKIFGSRFSANSSGRSGGVVFWEGTNTGGRFWSIRNVYEGNSAVGPGGVFNLRGETEDAFSAKFAGDIYRNNTTLSFGTVHAWDMTATEETPLLSINNFFYGLGPFWDNPRSIAWSFGDLYWATDGGDAINNTGWINNRQIIAGVNYDMKIPGQQKLSAGGKDKPLAICNDFGTNSFVSHGYNIASDGSCGLDQSTDLPNTDPLVGMDADGMPTLLAGSPAIDGGPAELWEPTAGFPLVLPCGHIDLLGNARPQDANGDGVFECDIGPVEILGAGATSSAHSAAFFNTLRNGEGTFVEVFASGLAVIYTFTFTPDGSAPAWMVTVGHVVGNSIISSGMDITSGTRFGDNFVAADVVRSNWGEMSMVFPDCETADDAGSVAFTGSLALGYEALLTRSTRLTSIIGCDGAKSANAGRSGSFYDIGRDGEGIIVQWLEDGRVMVMFFTYGLDGGQQWIFGVGTPTGSGNTVTINVDYPTGLTPWGTGFTPGNVTFTPWGTITLTYTDCNNLTFSYNSTIAGFGANSYNYTRLTKLMDTECPM